MEDVADAVWLQGERFGTVGIRVGDLIMEITTHRAESYVGDSRKPVVRFSTDLHEDLGRRDFTVNAMAVDVVDGQLHDPFDGRADLAAGILRTPLSPEESFGDDPLRMLRAARFHARYDLIPVDGLVEAARSDRKSTRLNSSHVVISYAVFCLQKKNTDQFLNTTPS